ncbi:hypothetical protein, partial [Sutterella wadsworthensis]|uniref:hypothetical protein n=1 Tax=Sutterella wadsworthensis TaxID=40545 RepID=UPI003967D3F4
RNPVKTYWFIFTGLAQQNNRSLTLITRVRDLLSGSSGSQLQPIRAGFGKKSCLPQDVHISREIWNLVTRFLSPAGRQSQVYFKLLDGFITVSKVKIFNKLFHY